MPAISRVIASTAPFDAVYATCGVAAPMWATNDATLMIEPPPDAIIAGIAYLQQRETPLTLISSTRSHTASLVFVGLSSSPGETPALLYSTCSPPNVATVSRIIAATDSSSVTLHDTKRALPPAFLIAATVSEPSTTSATTTLAPSRANNSAPTRPSPPAAPVITATLPSSRPAIARLSSRCVPILCPT